MFSASSALSAVSKAYAQIRTPVEFAEDALTLIGRNSRAGIPDFYTQLVGPMAATNQQSSFVGVPDGIRYQVPSNSTLSYLLA